MEIKLDLYNYEKENIVFRRTASRAIVNRGERYLLIHGKYGDYKFPGGGVEEGESLEDTMIREVKEETGYRVLRETVRLYGKVLERRKGEMDDIMEMNSHYFFCDVEDNVGEQNLDAYEEEYQYQVIWMTLNEAIEKNNQIADINLCPWVIRDTKVMETLILSGK